MKPGASKVAPGIRAAETGKPADSGATPARVVVLVAPANEFDAAELARHLAATSHGTASIALLSVGDPRASGPAVDYATTCERIWKFLEQRDKASDGANASNANAAQPQVIRAQSSPI